jgi:hypothetical protein
VAPDSGLARSCFTLLRAAGSSQTPSLISSHGIWAASDLRAPVSNKNVTNAPNGPGLASTALNKARISSSVRMRALARSFPLVRAMPRTIGDRNSSDRLAWRSSRAPYPFGDVKACLDRHQATRSPSISVAASRIGPESSAHESSTRSATARRTVRSTIGLPLLQRHELILRKRARHGVSRAGNVDLLFGILGPEMPRWKHIWTSHSAVCQKKPGPDSGSGPRPSLTYRQAAKCPIAHSTPKIRRAVGICPQTMTVG